MDIQAQLNGIREQLKAITSDQVAMSKLFLQRVCRVDDVVNITSLH